MNHKRLIEFWQQTENQTFINRIREMGRLGVNDIAKLSAQYPDFPLKDILSMLEIQKKNKHKIPEIENYLFSMKSAEQASSSVLAKYHARKFSQFSIIADLCCGNGMDLIYLAQNKKKVYAVDIDDNELSFARFNCKRSGLKNVSFLCAPAQDFTESVQAIFADPDRRKDKQRIIDPDFTSPSLQELFELNGLTRNFAIKISPAADYNKLLLPDNTTLEFIAEKNTLKEILICTEELSTPNIAKKAVILPSETILTNTGVSIKEIPISRFLFEPNKAIIRAGLVMECGEKIGYNLIDKKIALLTGSSIHNSTLGKCFEVVDFFPYDLKKLKRYCSKNDLGELIIKTRGFPEKIEDFRRKNNLKLTGKRKKILFIIRMKKYHIMIIVDEM